MNQVEFRTIQGFTFKIDKYSFRVKSITLKIITSLFAVLIFTCTAMMFSSCTMEKRHYRNGYYVQRVSVNINNHESSPRTTTFPSNFALTDTSESIAYEDAHLTGASVRAVEKSTTDSSATTSQKRSSASELYSRDENILPSVQTEQISTLPDSETISTVDDDKEGKPDHGKVWFWIFVSLMLVAILGIPCYFLGAEILAVAMIGIGSLGGIIAFVGSLISNRKKAGIQSEEAAKLRRKRTWASMWIFLGIILGIIVSIVSLILAVGA